MKKLLVFLFSLLISFNSYGENICNAKLSQEFLTLSVQGNLDWVDIHDDKLLTICEEDDILVLDGFKSDSIDTSLTTQEYLSMYMAYYCDLSETQIVNNQILVCKIVDRDF